VESSISATTQFSAFVIKLKLRVTIIFSDDFLVVNAVHDLKENDKLAPVKIKIEVVEENNVGGDPSDDHTKLHSTPSVKYAVKFTQIRILRVKKSLRNANPNHIISSLSGDSSESN